jgi:hypothetical protein
MRMSLRPATVYGAYHLINKPFLSHLLSDLHPFHQY